MIEAILLQIPPSVREVLWVCVAYYGNCLVYVEHVLLHHLVVPLLDFIQSPYHGIIVALVTECLLHVHQQVPHRDIFALIQCAGPFARLPTETGEDMGAHTGLIILLEEGIHIKAPEHYIASAPGSVDLKIANPSTSEEEDEEQEEEEEHEGREEWEEVDPGLPSTDAELEQGEEEGEPEPSR